MYGGIFSVALSVEPLQRRAKTRRQSTLPDVIRHTALWSSDFPLFQPRSPGNPGVRSRNSDHPA